MAVKTRNVYLFFIVVLIGSLIAFIVYTDRNKTQAFLDLEKRSPLALPELVLRDRVTVIEIEEGSTYGNLMKDNKVDYIDSEGIYQAAKDIYDLASIRVGRQIELVYNPDSDKLKELRYKVDSEDELLVWLETEATSTESRLWQAELKPIPYEIETVVAEGEIESSMYEAALERNIDIRAIIELANAFQWTIDFAMDPRRGDTFKFVYDKRSLENEYIMPGQIWAGIYINDGKRYEVYYFEENEENKGYFDQDGNSVQKIFLRAPVSYKYISSGYTSGARYIEAFSMYTSSHRAIDYAAALGSPVRAVGDGTIAFTRYSNSGYGNFISLRHNGTYTTQYAHLSKIYVRGGEKVKQGDVIGAVGSTGFSTGPHLHYEMLKNGVKVNPLNEVLPPGEPIKEENKERFKAEMEKYQALMGI